MAIVITCLGALAALVASFRVVFGGEEGPGESLGYLLVPTLAHASDEERTRDLVATERFALWLVVGALGAALTFGILRMLGLA